MNNLDMNIKRLEYTLKNGKGTFQPAYLETIRKELKRLKSEKNNNQPSAHN